METALFFPLFVFYLFSPFSFVSTISKFEQHKSNKKYFGRNRMAFGIQWIYFAIHFHARTCGRPTYIEQHMYQVKTRELNFNIHTFRAFLFISRTSQPFELFSSWKFSIIYFEFISYYDSVTEFQYYFEGRKKKKMMKMIICWNRLIANEEHFRWMKPFGSWKLNVQWFYCMRNHKFWL